MSQTSHQSNAPYDGSALIADPIHQYVSFTVPFSTADQQERTEKDLIDSPWVQRLTSISPPKSPGWGPPREKPPPFPPPAAPRMGGGPFAGHPFPFPKK